jgi:hypothetical protein
LVGAAPLAFALPLAAHHGTGASYDLSKPVTPEGTVTEFRYANPHPSLFFDVTDDKGNAVHWSGSSSSSGPRSVPARELWRQI